MSQDQIHQSGLRTLTLEEVNAVSGGFAVIPLLVTIAKVVVIGIIHSLDHSNNKTDNQNPHDSKPNN